jgi:carboxyl-terminal processing protease
MRRKFFLHILFSLLALLSVRAQPAPDADPAKVRMETFAHVWNTINEKHFDPTFGGVDWKQIGREYEPRVLSAKSDDEFYAVLQEMLGELNQSHFGIVPPNAQISATSFGEGEIGIEIQLIDGQFIVTRVEPSSPAAKAGLKTGYALEKIDGRSIREILAPLEEKLAARRDTGPKKMLYRERAVMTALGGKIGSLVTVEARDAGNKNRVFKIERASYEGERSAPFGNFPSQRVIFESKILPENIGYIRFNVWVIPQIEKLKQAVASMKDTQAIIFDLRGNPGGIGGMANSLAGLLFDKNTSLGTMRYRNGEVSFAVFPKADSYTGKIVILTDYATASTSEVFAAGMQETGRARIVGERTAGAVLPSVMEKLPTGALFQYAVADYKTPKKILIEGRGVIPDVEVKLTRESLLEGRDLQIEAAVQEIIEK